MPLPSTLFQDLRSTFSLRNAPRTMQSQTVQEDRQEEPRKEGEDTASVSYPQAWSCGCVGFRDQISPGPQSPLLVALTLHHAASRRCRRRSKAGPVVHWPGGSLGRATPQCGRAPHRDLTSLTARGATGGHCKNHRKNLSTVLIPYPLSAIDSLLQYAYQIAVHFCSRTTASPGNDFHYWKF